MVVTKPRATKKATINVTKTAKSKSKVAGGSKSTTKKALIKVKAQTFDNSAPKKKMKTKPSITI